MQQCASVGWSGGNETRANAPLPTCAGRHREADMADIHLRSTSQRLLSVLGSDLLSVRRSQPDAGWPSLRSDENLTVPALGPGHSSGEEKVIGPAAWLLGPVSSTDGERTVIDLERELAYWQDLMLHKRFHVASYSYAQLRPTLKFAYDSYLAWARRIQPGVLVLLECSYGRQIEIARRLHWSLAASVVRVVWLRLGVDDEDWCIASSGC